MSGARREKMHVQPYDLVPFQEMTDAYVRVAEFGAKKYTVYWGSECQGLLNVPNVNSIKIILPVECVLHAITKLDVTKETKEFSNAVNALCAEKIKPSKSKELVNVVLVTISDLKNPTLTITNVKNKTHENTTVKTKKRGYKIKGIDTVTRFLESVISEQSFLEICERWESRNKNTNNTNQKDVQSAVPSITFTLIMTTKQEISGEFFVQSVTTVLDFWAMMSKVLKKHCIISNSEIQVKQTGLWNWSKGLSRVQLIGSLLRHTFAYLRGQERDADSGLLHTDHILWNAVALTHNVHHNLEDGRRPEPVRDYHE